jgi:hypothetical protein
MKAADTTVESSKGVEIDGVIHLEDDDSHSRSTEVGEKDVTEKPAVSARAISEQYSSRLQTLEDVFRKAAAPDTPSEVNAG